MQPIRSLVDFLREPPAAPPIEDPALRDHTYRQWRKRMLYGSMVGYGLFYFTRKNISVALPQLSQDLGYSNTDLGLLASLLYISYAISKGLFGLVGDRVDPRRFMALGLALSAVVNLLFSFSASLMAFGFLWFVNGIFQAMGSPPCAKICVRWFSVSERGTKWGIWNISHQAGGGLILVIAGLFAEWFGWRGAFAGPALICMAGVFFILSRLRDRPEALGLPPIEQYRNDPECANEAEAEADRDIPFRQLFFSRVLFNPHLLLFALSSMCVYIVRYGTLDWGTKYLVEEKGASIAFAGTLTSLIEFIGIPGMLLAGWASDRFFNARRAPICVASLICLAIAIGLLFLVPPGYLWLDALGMAAIGFFTYGPQMLVAGVGAADTCGARVAAAAVGVTGAVSYLGAFLSAVGTGIMVDQFGWGGGFSLWAGTSVLGACLLVPLWNARGRRR